ncbi:MAG: aldehyde ferredoxin oxidoreductase C-terminal domain-containing protein, partial [archaeon]|nr:aldehyde ferredoxin oxidoreductase C-terminal domain-containing protein [archaeon]
PETKRKKIYDELVKGKYLAEFNERVIKTRSWKTCGEVCPAMCKKIDGKMKIDYEPYEANGPNCGIFDLKSAEKVVRLADENGFDAIHIGTIISFVIEAKMKGLLDDSEIKGAVSSDGCGAENEKIARKVVELIIKGEGIGLSLRKGLRRGSKELDAVSGCKGFNDIAVYVANGEDGEIAPNQYWVPGFFLPLPIQGKFLTYYGADFMLPEKLGMRSAQRFMLELDTDNSGICRFHRGWSEKMTERLLKAALGKGFRHDIKPVVKDIIEYNKRAGALPQLPESKRVKEIMRNYLKKVCCQGNRDILSLLESFEKDLDKGCLDYFESVKKGIEKVFDVEY